MSTVPQSTEDKLRDLSKALDGLERETAAEAPPESPKPRPIRVGQGGSKGLKLVLGSIYAVFALLALYTGGLPSTWSEFSGGFVIPGMACTFLYFFYKGAWSRAKTLTRPSSR